MTARDLVLLAACLTLVSWSAWRWAASARLPRVADVAVAYGVLFFGIVVSTVLLVGGLLQALTAGPIAAAAVLTAAAAGLTTSRPAARARVAATRLAARNGLPGLWPAVRSPQVLVLVVAATLAVGYRIAIAARFPAMDWDALAYHLPMADYWLQEHRVITGKFSYWTQIYPGAAESGTAWMGALTGTVRTAAAVQIGAALLAAVTVVALCQGAGRSLRSSLVGGLLFLLAPIVIVQLSTAEVDIVAAATMLATWHLVLVALRAAPAAGRLGRPAPALALAGVGAGLAVGVKTTNLLAVAVIGLVLVGTLCWRHLVVGRAPGVFARRLVTDAACLGLPALAVGGFWYARNYANWGNPFYPVPLGPLPGDPAVVALVGVDANQVGTHHRFWAVLVSWATDVDWRSYFYGSPTGGLGAQWLLVMAPAVLVGIVLAARSRHRLHAWGFLVPGVVLLLLYPGSYHTRYTMFLLAVGGVGLAFVLDALPRWPRQGLLVAVAGAAAFSATAASWNALDISGTYVKGSKPDTVLALMRAPDSVRGAIGLRRAFANVEKARVGSTIVVPPEFGDFNQPWVLPHALWADDLRRTVVRSPTPITDPAMAMKALADQHGDYVVVFKNSALEGRLLAAPATMHRVFEVGWLAWAWAPGPEPAT